MIYPIPPRQSQGKDFTAYWENFLTNDEARTLKMTKGMAWFFPSYMLHRVTPVTKGVRRSLVLWVGGPEFK
jgi:PKHD-type hydroxylase